MSGVDIKCDLKANHFKSYLNFWVDIAGAKTHQLYRFPYSTALFGMG
ncbi:hypothetical protein Plim_0667 [Planctopirus limnophila DSM 3776]|uniref:Uncharacterized protein n=1 Tax=Planctopirus limnophila (strain ATCC 43296 / DSM 3776 / IFAM 1008 / Mu 290) TaxID=521674 RepID=D5SR46_PLAL2|nr:hypothetical protein Plim_0667 [Planctopirus limnophila DSM 3776]